MNESFLEYLCFYWKRIFLFIAVPIFTTLYIDSKLGDAPLIGSIILAFLFLGFITVTVMIVGWAINDHYEDWLRVKAWEEYCVKEKEKKKVIGG